MKAGLDRFIYQSLLRFVYQVYVLQPDGYLNHNNSYDANSYTCEARANSINFRPFASAPANDQYQSVATFDGNKPVRYTHVMAARDNRGGVYEFPDGWPEATYGATTPPSSLTRMLFSSPSSVSGAIGFTRPQLFGALRRIDVKCQFIP